MLCRAQTRPTDDGVADLKPLHRFFKRYIKLFGIVPFYFFILVFDVFRIIAEVPCFDAWQACTNEHVADLLYPFIRMLYLGSELFFCWKFKASNFVQNTLMLCGLAVIQATNLSCWMDALVEESAVFLTERNWTNELRRCLNGTDVNISGQHDYFIRCFSHTSEEYHVIESASPYLFPFIMEYLMLVMECVADWFFSNAVRRSERHDDASAPAVRSAPPSLRTSRLELGASTSSMAGSGSDVRLAPVTSFEDTQDQQDELLQQDANSCPCDSVLPSSASDRQHDNDVPARPSLPTASVIVAETRCVPESRCHRVQWLRFGFVIASVFLSVLFLIFGICDLCLSNEYIYYRNVFMEYRIFYWLALSVVALVGYWASRRLRSEPMNPKGFEYFVILSGIGPVIQIIFTIVANVMSGGLIPTALFLAEEIINVIQIFMQVVFYTRVKSVQIRASEGEEMDVQELRCIRMILLGAIMYFAVCNFALWVEDSFIETRNAANSWQKQYIENWPVIYNVFNPLALVFRFNSGLLFLNVLFDKKR